MYCGFFFSSRRRHTRCALVTGVQTCALPILSYPHESAEYREARNALLEAEIALRAQAEAVAAQRRRLPPGGKVPEDYVFERLGENGMPEKVRMSELFGPHDTLILYSRSEEHTSDLQSLMRISYSVFCLTKT